jgi:hypothetical protein
MTVLDSSAKPSSSELAARQSQRVRDELAVTVDALGRKLAARHLVEKGLDMLKDNMDRYEALNRSLEVIRANPVPVALVGIGAAWLIAANTVPDERLAAARQKIADVASDLGSRAGGLASDLGGRIGLGGSAAADQPLGHTGNPMLDEASGRPDGWLHQVSDQMTGTARGALNSVRDSSAAMFNRVAGDGAGRVADKVTDAFERNPLMVGAIGIIAGALLAALLPITRTEDRLLRDSELPKKAGEVGEQAVTEMCDTAARTLDAAVAAVKGEADRPSRG